MKHMSILFRQLTTNYKISWKFLYVYFQKKGCQLTFSASNLWIASEPFRAAANRPVLDRVATCVWSTGVLVGYASFDAFIVDTGVGLRALIVASAFHVFSFWFYTYQTLDSCYTWNRFTSLGHLTASQSSWYLKAYQSIYSLKGYKSKYIFVRSPKFIVFWWLQM